MSAGPADKVLDSFKTLVWNQLIDRATNAAVLAINAASWGVLSFLSGPLNYLIGKIVTWLGDQIYEGLSKLINLQTIFFLDDAHMKAYLSASDALTFAYDKYGPDSPQFKKERDARKAALSKFVMYS